MGCCKIISSSRVLFTRTTTKEYMYNFVVHSQSQTYSIAKRGVVRGKSPHGTQVMTYLNSRFLFSAPVSFCMRD